MNVVPSPEIWHRDDFPILCNWRRLWRAAEIGVDRGLWAEVFLARWQGWQWWGIDDYQPYPEMPFDREADFAMALSRIAAHASRARILREASASAMRPTRPATQYLPGVTPGYLGN